MTKIALGLVLTGLVATSAYAEPASGTRLNLAGALRGVTFATPAAAAAPQAAAAEPSPTVSVLAGADFPSLYFFRGIRQEFDADVTFQPFVDVAIKGEKATVNVGTWNSFHSGTNVSFYESDLYASVSFSAGKVTPKVLWTSYTSPDDGFNTVHELAFSLGVDDSENAVPLAPSFLVAFEVGDFGADAGANKGTYFEAGIAPAIPMAEDAPLTLTVPIKLGMSLKDYYENPVTGEDSKFGYLSIGLTAGVPVNDMMEVHAGVQVLALGETLKVFNVDKSSKVVASVGFSVSF